jgi:hypothetical protein
MVLLIPLASLFYLHESERPDLSSMNLGRISLVSSRIQRYSCIENGQSMFLYIGRNVVPLLLNDLFIPQCQRSIPTWLFSCEIFLDIYRKPDFPDHYMYKLLDRRWMEQSMNLCHCLSKTVTMRPRHIRNSWHTFTAR